MYTQNPLQQSRAVGYWVLALSGTWSKPYLTAWKCQTGLTVWHILLIAGSFPHPLHIASTNDWTKYFQTFSKSDFLRFKYISYHPLYWVSIIYVHICVYSLRYMICTSFFACISPETKTCEVLIYYCELVVLQWPACQVHSPILKILVKSALMPASSPKRKQFKWSRWTNSERENTKGNCFSKFLWNVLEGVGRGTQVSWPSGQSFSYLTKPCLSEWFTKISRGNHHLQLGLERLQKSPSK